MPSKIQLLFFGLFIVSSGALQTISCYAEPAQKRYKIESLMAMELEDLMNLPVFSVDKYNQSLRDTAAAVHIITAEDIERSTATSIPDLLRTVPGVQVSAVNAHTWAVSIRGHNDIFANKLLVLIDGRIAYHWGYTGTEWYRIDTPLSQIERIEVILGPGATIWGTNAVNGVISIVSKSNKNQQGWNIHAGGGNLDKHYIDLSYSNKSKLLEPDYQVFFKSRQRSDFDSLNHDDDWSSRQLGFAYQYPITNHNQIQLRGDITYGNLDEVYWNPRDTEVAGDYVDGNIMAQYQYQAYDYECSINGYYEHISHDFYYQDSSDTWDLDFNYLYSGFEKHKIQIGAGARHIKHWQKNQYGFFIANQDNSFNILSAFLQDKFKFHPNWTLNIGVKFEHNTMLDDSQFMPHLRLLWNSIDNLSIWGSISRAVRMPSRLETELNVNFDFPGYTVVLSHNNVEREELIAYETGLRYRLSLSSFVELNLFSNHFDDLLHRTMSFGSDGKIYMVPDNLVDENYSGAEFKFHWQNKNWSATTSYAYLENSVFKSGESQQQFNFVANWQPSDHDSLSFTLRYVDEKCDFIDPVVGDGCIDSYTGLDISYNRKINRELTVKFAGRDLLKSSHYEFDSNGGYHHIGEVPRSIWLSLNYQTKQ